MVMFNDRMDARRRAEVVARNVRAASLNTSLVDLAKAADTDPGTLEARLNGSDEITVADLIGVGGLLCVHPTSFLKGAHE